MNRNIQFVTALHGNEYMPTLAIASLGLPQTIGNPKALAVGKRFIDADLNGVFGTHGEGYEYTRASELLQSIETSTPVIDFHTFSAESDPFAIFVDAHQFELAKKTGIKKLIYMKNNFKKGRALINHVTGVSVEVGTHTSPQSFEVTQQIVKNVLNENSMNHDVEIFEVYDTITQPGDYVNFQEYNNEFYPVLAGPNPYNFYGLKARRISSYDLPQ
ncbi:succinylglutamate desuccinylase/aspartoacylase family protein [Candidatus Woesebacteria bacterium]|nr:succinylglutamate desuccinylase/aspartoacylase family protein [Candidatus Woesebacteria bacterium]